MSLLCHSTLELLHINLLGDPLGADAVFRWRLRVPKRVPVHISCSYGNSKKDRQRATCRVLDDRIIDKDAVHHAYRQLIIAVRLPPLVIDGVLQVSAGRGITFAHSSFTIEPKEFDSHVSYSAEADPVYDSWLRRHQSSKETLEHQRDEIASWDEKPLISIVTPVFRTPKEFLQKMLESVLCQTYTNFELIVVNVSGPCPDVDDTIASCTDQRVHVIEAENKDISQNTNLGIAAARGAYVAFVDHDDFIEPDALYWYVREIREYPQADLLFCAEDLWGDGRFWGARFKPGWNPDLVFTHNYICHMLCVSRWALDHTQRPTTEVAAAQDYDLTLKVSEIARDICYVPRCLYHWRVHSGSIAINHDSKPYALEAGRRAIQAHFSRLNIAVNVVAGSMPLSYKVNYLSPPSSVTVIIPSLKHNEELVSCLERVSSLSGELCHEIIVISAQGEKNPPEALFALATKDARIRLLSVKEPKPDKAMLANKAAHEAHSEALVFLDPSCVPVDASWLDELVGPLARGEVGCVGPLVLAADGLVAAHGLLCQPDGGMVPVEIGRPPEQPGYMTMLAHCRDVVAVPSCCQAFLRSRFLESGGYRGEFGVLMGAELCLRVAAYPKSLVVSEPYGKVQLQSEFLVSETFAAANQRMLLLAAYPGIVQGDPYLDPHLRQGGGHFELRDAARDTLAL